MAYKCQTCNEEFEPDADCIIMPKNEFACFMLSEWIHLCPECTHEYEDDE